MTYEEYLLLGRPVNSRGEIVFEECPDCHDSKWHFYYNSVKEVGHCKKCGYSPRKRRLIVDLGLIFEHEEKPLIDVIVEKLDELDRDISGVISESEGEEEFIPLPVSSEPAYHFTSALSYLQKRQVSLRETFDYELSYCRKGPYKGRIIFPIRDITGDLVGFTSRGIHSWSAVPKYKSPKAFKISHYLYGEDMIPKGIENLIIVEGPFDRLRVGDDCVATFGKKMSQVQVHKILRLRPRSVSIVWDSDAMRESLKLAAALSYYLPTRVVQLPEGRDPGSMRRREVWSLVRRTPLFKSLTWNLMVGGLE